MLVSGSAAACAKSSVCRHAAHDAFVDQVQLAVGAGPHDGARIPDLVAGLEQCDLGADGAHDAAGVIAQHLVIGAGAAGETLARTLVSTGLTEIALTSTSRSWPVGVGSGRVMSARPALAGLIEGVGLGVADGFHGTFPLG
jgi:hypothetical protein